MDIDRKIAIQTHRNTYHMLCALLDILSDESNKSVKEKVLIYLNDAIKENYDILNVAETLKKNNL